MTRRQVAVRGILAAPVAGALCSLGFLLVLSGVDAATADPSSEHVGWLALIVIWLVAGAPIGMVAGVALGVLPVVVSVAAWPALEQRFGTARGIEVVVLMVGGIGFLETLFVAWAFDVGVLAAVGWALGAAVVSALTLRWPMRRALRATRPY